MVKNIRVGIVGLGHISHRHMQIYKHINELAVFLSDELGRSVTYDEIVEKSPSYYIKEQEIGGQMYTYDLTV